MPKIYRQAWNTVIWLGEAQNNSDLALDIIPIINSALQFFLDSQILEEADLERL